MSCFVIESTNSISQYLLPSVSAAQQSVNAKCGTCIEARDARVMRRSWAQLIKRIYEVDPLVCPSCGSEMKVIAFITEHDVIDAILRHLAKTEARSPRGPPGAATLPATS